MIRVYRGSEPRCLAPVRARELAHLRAIEAIRPVKGEDITGYDVVKEDLWKRQHGKCCYCERKEVALFNDVEHFRPKGRADRSPGCVDNHGYFWLAFTWKNLLFACQVCNRSVKRDQFPLAAGSRALNAWEDPPGLETCLLLDPAKESGVPHIQFVPWHRSPKPPQEQTWSDIFRWQPKPRNGSERGRHSIDVCGIDHEQYKDPYLHHVRDNVSPAVDKVRAALALRGEPRRKAAQVKQEVAYARKTLLTRSLPLVGLSYDALRYFVPDRLLAPFRAAWPSPEDVGDPLPRRRSRHS